jgi:type IV pilus biogenesis protein CpaD/CtpE
MAVVQGRTRAQLRQSIGYNLGAIYVSSATDTGSTSRIVDNTLIGADDNHIGKWVIFNDASASTVETSRVSDYESSTTKLTVSPAFANATVANDTYELWDDIYSPARIDDLINQAVLDATGHAYDPVEKLDLHTDGTTQRFDIPSGLSMIQNIYYRSNVDFTRLHACATTFDETEDDEFTQALDTKDKKQGAQSLKITLSSSAEADDVIADSITSVSLAGYDTIEMWVKSTTATSAGNLKLHLDSATITEATAHASQTDEALSIPALSADTWTFVRMSLDNPESDTAIVSIALEQDADLGACTVWLDDISVVKNDSAQWAKIPRHLWKIDKEAKDIVLDNYAHGTARYNLLKLVGGDKPALLTTDSATSEIDEQYVISRATALAFASASGGPNTDPDNKNNMAGFWMGLSAAARRAFPLLTDIRLVE